MATITANVSVACGNSTEYNNMVSYTQSSITPDPTISNVVENSGTLTVSWTQTINSYTPG